MMLMTGIGLLAAAIPVPVARAEPAQPDAPVAPLPGDEFDGPAGSAPRSGDVSQERLETAVAELEKLDTACNAVRCDITDSKSVAELVEISSAFGAVGAVIHTAG